jgi:hypothetical protein
VETTDPLAPYLSQPVADSGYTFVRGTCPYCDKQLAKLPARTGGKCPNCASPIRRVNHVDHLIYLTRTGEDGQIRAEAEGHYATFRAPWDAKGTGYDPEARRRFSAWFLWRYARLGLQVAIIGSDNCCPKCVTLRGTTDPAVAPPLPFRDCQSRSRYCFCEWFPHLPGAAVEPQGPHSVTL